MGQRVHTQRLELDETIGELDFRISAGHEMVLRRTSTNRMRDLIENILARPLDTHPIEDACKARVQARVIQAAIDANKVLLGDHEVESFAGPQ